MTRRSEREYSPTGADDFGWFRPTAPEARFVSGADLSVWVPWHAKERHPDAWAAIESEADQDARWMIVSGRVPYHPLRDHPVMFREFSELAEGGYNPEAFLSFADRYGPLNGLEETHLPDSERTWLTEALAMRFGVSLFDALRDRREDDIRDLISVREATHPNGVPLAGLSVVRVPLFSEMAGLVRDGASVREMAQSALSALVESALVRSCVSPTLHRVPEAWETTGLRLALQPRTLLGAMWLQLALAIDGDRKYDRCAYCHAWWDSTHSHPSKETCSDKCRKAKSRRDKKAGGPQ